MNRTFVQLAAILALLTFVLKLSSEQDPFDSFIFSGLIFIAVIFIVLLGFYFMRTGISFMENQVEGETEINLENDDEPIESEEI
tara:strand:- start:932 stop:1183 length:252 start_codon:yes stop_codon:yes gene_type:complete